MHPSHPGSEPAAQNLTTEIGPASVSPDMEQAITPPRRAAATASFAKNALMSVGRLFIQTLVTLMLPAFLAHRLPVKTYSAWVLLLQMSAYVGYLDFGIQTGISKFVAEYDARDDHDGATARASAGLFIMVVAAILGAVLILILAWRAPHFFGAMPADLDHGVRLSLIFVGFSLSFGLLCGVPSAIFLGLQRYAVPMTIQLVNRVLYTAVVVAAVFLHKGLATMGAGVALVNVVTGLIQVQAWRRGAAHIRLTFKNLDLHVVKEMFSYCSVLAIWTLGMLCVSGLDLTIVGKFDYGETAFYAIAILPTNFIISIMGAAIGPLLPGASALNTTRSPLEMGRIIERLTRYTVLMLGLSGVPMAVLGYWILAHWVGHEYAKHTVKYLQVLLIANIIRQIGLPYSTVLAATNNQRVAIGGAVAEAVVNLGTSLILVRHIGAMGVAYGTLLGSIVSICFHFVVNMGVTYPLFSVSRMRLLLNGVMRPLLIAIPSLVIVPFWWGKTEIDLSFVTYLVWGASTLAIAWYVSLDREERLKLIHAVTSRTKTALG